MSKNNKLLDKLIVIDVEASCYENNNWPKGEQQEIIEVGVCLLDLETLQIENPRGLLIRPIKSSISPFCTQLTTLTQQALEDGLTLVQAMSLLEKEYLISRRTWASWGDFDKKLLLKDCADKGIKFPGEKSSHVNIKNLMAIFSGWNKEVGMDEALKRHNLSLAGVHHRGVYDAQNIAKLFKHLLKLTFQWNNLSSFSGNDKDSFDEYH